MRAPQGLGHGGGRRIQPVVLPGQRRVLVSTKAEVLYSGALGSGKSRALCMKALLMAQRYPGSTHALVRKRLASLKRTTLETFFKEVCHPSLVVDYNRSEQRITVLAGKDATKTSTILAVGLVNDKGDVFNIRSLTLGCAFLDEATECDENEYVELSNRLRDPYSGLRQIASATNPASRGHWLYRRFYVERDPDRELVRSNSLENHLLPEDYRQRIDKLKGRYRQRFVEGEWVGFEGLVYDVYDPTLHSITWGDFAERWGQPSIPDDWPRVRAIDFGYANPFCCLWFAIAPDGTWYKYREIYFTRRLVEDHARQILELSRNEPEPLATYADHDAEGRATLHRAGVRTIAARKEVKRGIESVYKALTPDPQTGTPQLYFIRDTLVEEDPALRFGEQDRPVSTEEEFHSYHYPKGTTARNPQENPVPLHDHGMDTTRYAWWSFQCGAGIGSGRDEGDARHEVIR